MGEEGRNVRRRFKIAFVALLVVTIAWTVAWRQHIIDYKQWVKASEERWQKQLEEHKSGTWDPGLGTPFFAYKHGPVLVISGWIICIAWEFLLEGVYKDWRKGKAAKNEKVGWAVKILKTLANLVIFILYPIVLFSIFWLAAI